MLIIMYERHWSLQCYGMGSSEGVNPSRSGELTAILAVDQLSPLVGNFG